MPKKIEVEKSVLQLFADWMAGNAGKMFKVDWSDIAFVIRVADPKEMEIGPKKKPKKKK